MKMYYFREFKQIIPPGETEPVKLSEISLLERLAFSAYITALKQRHDSIDFIKIIFGNRASRKNLEDTVKMLGHILKDRVNVCHWIKQNYDKRENKNLVIHTIEINTDDIFTTRLGRSQKSIDNIAFRAFVLASAKSRCKDVNPLFDTIQIYNWVDSSVIDFYDADERLKNNVIYHAPRIRELIQKWIDSVGIEAHFKDKMTLVIDGMKKKENKEQIAELKSGPMFPQIEEKIQLKKEFVPIDSFTTSKDSIESQLKKDLNYGHEKWKNSCSLNMKNFGEDESWKVYQKLEEWIKDSCKAIAKKFNVDSDSVYDQTKTNSLCGLDKKTYFNVIDSLKALKIETYKMVCDDEDEYEFANEDERKVAKSLLFSSHWNMMNT